MKYYLEEDRAKRLQQVLKTFPKSVNRWYPGTTDMGQGRSSAPCEVPQISIFVYLKDYFNPHRMTLLANSHQYSQTKKTLFSLKTSKLHCPAELPKPYSYLLIKGTKNKERGKKRVKLIGCWEQWKCLSLFIKAHSGEGYNAIAGNGHSLTH